LKVIGLMQGLQMEFVCAAFRAVSTDTARRAVP